MLARIQFRLLIRSGADFLDDFAFVLGSSSSLPFRFVLFSYVRFVLFSYVLGYLPPLPSASTCYLERSVQALHSLQVHAPSSDWYNICASARALKIKHLCYIQPSFFRRKTQAQSRAAPGTKRYTEAFVKRNEAEKHTPNQNNDNDI